MTKNIVKLLENQLRDRPMKTINPNTQTAGDEDKQSAEALYHRAIIAAALAGLLEYSRADEHVQALLSAHGAKNYGEQIFQEHFADLEKKVLAYSGYKNGRPREDFNYVMQVLSDIVAAEAAGDPRAAKDYISSQRANIVSYLPGDLQAGQLLNNSTIDDRTNKMHGPFSDFTHWMEQLFSTADQ